MDSFFDIHDAKGYVLLKDSKKKAIVGDEIIDLRPYLIQEEQRLAKHQQLRTPESETATPTVEPPKKRKAGPLKPKEIVVRPTPKTNIVARNAPKRARLVSTTPEPQMSEYEKMQLLIANAASEATKSSPRTKRVRRMSTAEPLPKPTQQPASPVIQKSRPNLPPRIRKISSVDITVAVQESVTSPKSPKVAVYDEWQELLKNAQKEAEAGTGRSRRVRRPRPEEDEIPHSPRKRSRKEMPKPDQTTSSRDDAKLNFQSTSINELKGDEVPENGSSIVVNSVRNDTKHEVAGTAERMGTGYKETDFGIKIRRNIRALGGDEISKVKSEMAMVQPYLNNTQSISEPSYISEKPTSDSRPRERSTAGERPVFARRKSQPYKFAEAELLEENRLFMFAILATEGVMGNQRTM
jgi:hypothetical protein